MKTKIKILTAMMLVLTTFTFLSCKSNDDDEIFAPLNTWVHKDYSYTYTNTGTTSTTNLRCYFMFSRSGYSYKKGNSSETLPAGLTVVIVPAAQSTSTAATALLNTLGDKNYILKTFELNKATDSGDSDSFSFTMTETKWNVFYIANFSTFYPTESTSTPTQLASSAYTELSEDEVKANFSWKKLLLEYLLLTL